jgi:hypothetical protein
MPGGLALAGYLLHPTRFMRGGSLPGTKFASPGIHDADFAKAPQAMSVARFRRYGTVPETAIRQRYSADRNWWIHPTFTNSAS